MPLPRQISVGVGQLVVHPGFRLQVQAEHGDMIVESAVERCRRSLESAAAFSVREQRIEPGAKHRPQSLLIVVHASTPLKIGTDESYSLTIDPSGARLEAPTSLGFVRGLATLRQLAQRNGERVTLPAVKIEDAPTDPWRGLMLDVSRHFLPIALLKRNLDAMEMVKLNVLHLHLSDNEGFRMESKGFPRLQQDGSNGEFYTQAEMKDLIRYAELRGILIVSEFDMPSHAKSWLAGIRSYQARRDLSSRGFCRTRGLLEIAAWWRS
jgi:hexosaminidase